MENIHIKPYQFIPLQEHKIKADFSEELKYSGKMRIIITTKTPLLISNTCGIKNFDKIFSVDNNGNIETDDSTEKVKYIYAPTQHNSNDFFSYKGFTNTEEDQNDHTFEIPIIPGRVIGRVIRNVYETLTASCMSSIDCCKEKSELCPSCYLFGTVGTLSDNGKDLGFLKSRILFFDAHLSEDDKKIPVHALYEDIMTMPKLSSVVESHIKQPAGDAVFWPHGNWKEKNHVHFYDSETPLKIVGRKYYWHDLKWRENFRKLEPTSKNIPICPLHENISFEAEIYFNHISETELQKLFWICNISKNGEQGYKLGEFQPFGFGSVEMKVKDITLKRTIELTNDGSNYQYYTLTKEECALFPVSISDAFPECDKKIQEAFNIITNFNAIQDCNVR